MTTISIRPETADADRDAIRRITEAAFGRPREADIVDRVRASPGWVPELSLVAEREGEIVGHVLLSEATVEGEAGASWTVLALGPIAVLPACQRQGIGSALMREGLARATALSYRAVVLIGHPTYYPRFGFVPASRFGLRLTMNVRDEIWMTLPLRPDGLDGVHGSFTFPAAFGE